MKTRRRRRHSGGDDGGDVTGGEMGTVMTPPCFHKHIGGRGVVISGLSREKKTRLKVKNLAGNWKPAVG